MGAATVWNAVPAGRTLAPRCGCECRGCTPRCTTGRRKTAGCWNSGSAASGKNPLFTASRPLGAPMDGYALIVETEDGRKFCRHLTRSGHRMRPATY